MNTPSFVFDFIKNFSNKFTGSTEITVNGDGVNTPFSFTITEVPLSKLEDIAEGDDGLNAGTLQEVLQALATRIQALEDAAE